MRPPCEVVVRVVLPAFRSLVARELIEEHDLSQVAAASKLGTTQAAISQYLYSKRGAGGMKRLQAIPSVRKRARKIAEEIANGDASIGDATLGLCEVCRELMDRKVLCNFHQELYPCLEKCSVCIED